MIQCLYPFDEAGDRQVLALHAWEQVRSGGQRRAAAPRLECIETRLGGCECVRLVLNAADRNERHARLPEYRSLFNGYCRTWVAGGKGDTMHMNWRMCHAGRAT